MITDARVLSSEHLPDPQIVVHRHDELDRLADALQPIANGQHSGTTTHLYGPSGSGKSTVARLALSKLREQTLAVETAHIDCWDEHTGSKLLRALVRRVSHELVHQSSSRDELLDILRDVEDPLVVVLDEADQIDDPGVLRDLYEIRGLTLVLIANREVDLMGHLEESVASRLRSGVRVNFGAYSDSELVDILEPRAQHGLEPKSVSERMLRRIAREADGDARLAIGILRTAAKLAEVEGDDEITSTLVERAAPEARDDLRQKHYDRLTSDQQTLLDIVLEAGDIRPGELYARYRRQVENPKSDRTLRKYVSKLEHYNLIETSGKSQGRVIEPRHPSSTLAEV